MGRISTKEGGPRKTRVIIVELKIDIPDTPEITVFGSKKAVSEYFGDALGVSYTTLRTINVYDNVFENKRCRIRGTVVLTDRSPEIVERREREGREEIKNTGKENIKRYLAKQNANTQKDPIIDDDEI